ncbi:type II toxin-antitoxin system RelE/ParE family toxin [Flavobacterium sp.]|jgi:plasmid stabilization system protein ParE|uniref:type II toxin-antitoxin system RelE/ParE family toxin n=1 Tax=Flavobacterium sp. TaxID=239 RepID=UPI0037BE7788
MKINISERFMSKLNNQVDYIAADKPQAARKFKNDLLKNIKKDLKQPFHFKKSRYFDNENIRDYVFKGYVVVYEVDIEKKIVYVFGFIKYKDSL